ncbi:MAG TPA: DUF1571 domain-containing protein [Bacteroidia bacterium]|nr:DUF1571 domain-containing protein [Bacteroidia bacterium]
MIRYVLVFLIAVCSSRISAQVAAEKIIMDKMMAGYKSLRTAKFLLKSTERFKDGTLHESEMLVKMQSRPRHLYIYCVQPNPGVEVLWREKVMDEKLLINPNGFPYVTLKLSPYHSLLRKETHHTINDMGFDYLMDLVRYYSVKLGGKFYSYFEIVDTVMWDNRSCIVLAFDYKDYQYLDYTVRIGEDLTSIANSLYLNDFSLLLLNPSVKSYSGVEPGQVIRVPNFYCRKIVFYIDRSSWLPLVQEIYDAQGLYEKYEFKSFIQDPVMEPDEFTAEYKKYKF